MLMGEWTPRYMHDPWSVPLLAAAAPQARILLILRDPLERFRSGLGHEVHFLGQSCAEELVDDVFRRGLYAAQLRRLFDHFPEEQVLVLQYERCVSDTKLQLAVTYDFLGLFPYAPPELTQRRNTTLWPKLEPPPARRQAIVEAYRQDAKDVAMLVPTVDVELWKTLHQADQKGLPSPFLPKTMRAMS
jgi:hypothetical protein